MSRIIIKKTKYFILLILLISCNSHYNTKKLSVISELEQITKENHKDLNLLEINNIESILKIAKFNLSRLEEKQLDSIAIELIYFEYRDYLTCINIIHECVEEITNLRYMLSTNANQLKNMKADYKNSRFKRDDLDKYLLQESDIVKDASIKVRKIINVITREKVTFNNLNKKIEEIIN